MGAHAHFKAVGSYVLLILASHFIVTLKYSLVEYDLTAARENS